MLPRAEGEEVSPRRFPVFLCPATTAMVSAGAWEHPYPREQGAFPAAYLKRHKYWPAVARVLAIAVMKLPKQYYSILPISYKIGEMAHY